MATAHQIAKNGMSLAEFFRLYPSDLEAEAQFVARRWPDGIHCPHCGSDPISDVKSRRPQPWRCRARRWHFSHTTYTPMHDTKLGAQTWLLGLFLSVSNPKGRSSVQLAADLGSHKSQRGTSPTESAGRWPTAVCPTSRALSRWTRPTSGARRGTCTRPVAAPHRT